MSTQPTPERILQTGLAFWPAKTLLSAIELDVFGELARGPESFDALRGRQDAASPRHTQGAGGADAA